MGYWIAVTAGDTHTCALRWDRATFCWGMVRSQGSTGTLYEAIVPTRVAGAPPFEELAAGGSHTCGRTGDGVVYCWGANARGQIGNGTTNDASTPVRVSNLSGARAVGVAASVSCALTASRDVYCWGEARKGRLGFEGESPCLQICPQPFLPASGNVEFATLSVGLIHSCGVDTQSRAYCWGSDQWGQLGVQERSGYDSNTYENTPTPVLGGRRWDQVAAGALHSCGLSAGETWCWGSIGWFAEAVGGQGREGSATPRRVSGPGFERLFINHSNAYFSDNTCGLTHDGAAYCWGPSPDLQLGSPGPGICEESPIAVPCWAIPTPVATTERFTSLALGVSHMCGLTTEGAVLCWGSDDRGQLGAAGRGTSAVPHPVVTP